MSNYYVHWYMANSAKKVKKQNKKSLSDIKFYEAQAKRIEHFKMQHLANVYKNMVKKNSGLSSKQAHDFLKDTKLIFQKGNLASVINEAFQLVNSSSPYLNLTQEEIEQCVQKNQLGQVVGYTGKLKDGLAAFEKFILTVETVFGQDLFSYLQYLKATSLGVDKSLLNMAISKLGDTNAATVLNNSKKIPIEQALSKYESSKQQLNTVKNDLATMSLLPTKAKMQATDKDSLGSFIQEIFSAQYQMAGVLLEYLVHDSANLLIESSLLKGLGKGLSVVSSTHTGKKSSQHQMSFRTGTMDIKLDIHHAKLSMTLPTGLSLKKSKTSTRNEIKSISLKSSTVGKMLDILEQNAGIINYNQRQSFYNIYASHGRQKQGVEGYYRYNGNLSTYLQQMNKLFLLPALAGSLTKDDLSIMFIVNNRAYSIYEILASSPDIKVSGGLSLSGQVQDRRKHKWKVAKEDEEPVSAAKRRSDEIINIINSRSINLRMTLKLSQMKRLL